MAVSKVWIVLASPAGTTRQVGEAIKETAAVQGATVTLIDLAEGGSAAPDADPTEELRQSLGEKDVLFVGSPTYANHPLPLITDFLQNLSGAPAARAAVFTTYGLVSSGMTLYEMGTRLQDGGMTLLGGIKVPAAHSMLWDDEDQPGRGRPDENDLAAVSRFADQVLHKAAAETPAGIALEDLNYQRQEVRERAAEAGLHVIKPVMLPMQVDEDACTECGQCVDNCPTGNISLDPKPVFGDQCIVCFNCVRVCEEGAVTNNILPKMKPELEKRMEFFQEPAEVRMFV
ncbi:MAG: 4Fe-4S binding protein [Desulfosudaceae bacterium]